MALDDPVTELRALLDQFLKSPCSDLFIRSGEMTVFMARPGGAPNPMQQQPAQLAVPGTGAAGAPVKAPHLGLFEPACSVGDTIHPGGRIGSIDVLGRKTDVVSESGGRIMAIVAGTGDLVEFDDTLVELAAA
ncbi:MAG: hypothetical protein R3E09_07345 [Novosphingobium sp.]|nr:hypothetical protein [Novosphingobium sp.]